MDSWLPMSPSLRKIKTGALALAYNLGVFGDFKGTAENILMLDIYVYILHKNFCWIVIIKKPWYAKLIQAFKLMIPFRAKVSVNNATQSKFFENKCKESIETQERESNILISPKKTFKFPSELENSKSHLKFHQNFSAQIGFRSVFGLLNCRLLNTYLILK